MGKASNIKIHSQDMKNNKKVASSKKVPISRQEFRKVTYFRPKWSKFIPLFRI